MYQLLEELQDVQRRHTRCRECASTCHDVVRALLHDIPVHRWDCRLADIVTVLARRDSVPRPTDLAALKRIFDMDRAVAYDHLRTCVPALTTSKAKRWCKILWFDRLEPVRSVCGQKNGG